MKLNIKSLVLVCFVLFTSLLAQAQVIDTIEVYSPKMDRVIKNVVILPESYSTDTVYPVLYLLHGYGGQYFTWSSYTKNSLPQDASTWNMIIVCPDGQNSWYWDSPVDPTYQFETYVSKELVQYVDSTYSTIQSPKGRAITGFSMGGHGGFWLGFRHPDVFGACGSMSGGVDIRPFPKAWEMEKRLGAYADNKEVWDNHTVINLLDKVDISQSAIIFDCGVGDFFYEVNENLHKALMERKIPHNYIIRPGEHNHKYWNNALDYQLMFFHKYFIEK